jgi:ferredoxin
MGAIDISESHKAVVDEKECVECGVCVRNAPCPVKAIHFNELEWPRILRRFFSDPNFSHSTTTKGMGRGTAEMKTNDVTGRYGRGEVGIGLELGRPSTGVWFKDIEKVTKHLAPLNIGYEEKNPLTVLLEDPDKGIFKEEVMGEKLLSTIVEFKVPIDKLLETLKYIKELDGKLDTVYSVFICTRAEKDGSLPNIDLLKHNGYWVSPNAKHNVGMGRPYFMNDSPAEVVERSC